MYRGIRLLRPYSRHRARLLCRAMTFATLPLFLIHAAHAAAAFPSFREECRTSPTGVRPLYAAVSDFDLDGRLDIATANFMGGSVSILRGAGARRLQPHQDWPTAPNPAALVVADLNEDGHDDLVTVSASSSQISVLLGAGDGTFAPHVDLPTGASPFGVDAADLNHDGHLDLIATNSSGDNVSIRLGSGVVSDPIQIAQGVLVSTRDGLQYRIDPEAGAFQLVQIQR